VCQFNFSETDLERICEKLSEKAFSPENVVERRDTVMTGPKEPSEPTVLLLEQIQKRLPSKVAPPSP